MNYLNNLSQFPAIIFYTVYLWSLFWKGLALWKSAKDSQRNWFLAVLVLNTVGLLELIYLFFFAKNKLVLKDLKIWERLRETWIKIKTARNKKI